MKSKLIFLLFFIPSFVYAQSGKLDFEIGGGGQFLLNTHNSDFTKLNEIPNCCPRFTEGGGNGFAGFLFFKMPLFDNISGQLRLGFVSDTASFLYSEKTKVSVDDQAVDGEFQHTLNSFFSRVCIQPIFSYEFLENFNVNFGLNLGFLMTGTYYQIEEITKPTDRSTYIKDGEDTGLREWNESEGDIPKMISMQMGGLAGVSYDLQLNKTKTMWLTPEIYYSYGFNDIAENTPWKVNNLLMGLTFKYRPNPPAPIKRPGEEKIEEGVILANEIELWGNQRDIYFGEFDIKEPALKPIKVMLEAQVEAVGLQEGQEFKQATMVVEEFLSTNMRPLLNYIFFDNNSSTIPDRYIKLEQKKAEKFSNANLCNITTLPTYYNILNIIGNRLQDNPGTTLNITGCNSGTGGETMAVSTARANAIKDYISGIWGVEQNRLITSATNLPDKPSNKSDKDGIEENRRAEIKSDSWEIMKPVVTEDTLRKVSPPVIRFYMKSQSENKISDWKLTALQNGEVLKTVSGKDSLPSNYDWQIDREKESIPKFSEPIEYIVEITDDKGNKSISNTGLLPTEMITIQKKKENRLGDKRIDRYSLILFDYASKELSGANEKIIDFIKGNLQSDSRLLISGFTDRMGETEFNFKLSKDRAEQTAMALQKPTSFTRGVGESLLIYDNDLPEGRFYCRTVEIEVETPMSWNK